MFMTGTSWGTSVSSVCCPPTLALLLQLWAPRSAFGGPVGGAWCWVGAVVTCRNCTVAYSRTKGEFYSSSFCTAAAVRFATLSLPAEGNMETGVFPPDMNDSKLLLGVVEGNLGLVKAAMQAGANVNGCPTQPCTPIVNATIGYYVGIVQFLLERGADPDRPVLAEISGATPGERALHTVRAR